MTQIQRRTDQLATGTFADAKAATEALRLAAETMNLVSPATSVGVLPEGCSVALSHVFVDLASTKNGNFVNYTSGDVYDVGAGKLGLSKTVLQKIGAALGVSWDPVASGRLDDGSDPYYCRWRAVGKYRSFDGQVQTLVAEKEMDLREGSPQIASLLERYESKLAKFRAGKDRYEPKHPGGQIREMRLHIQAHAESKAQLRALRSMGIKTSYSVEELQRPFVAARVTFNGQTNDPVLRRIFAEKIADSFLDANRSLYGASAAPQVHPTAQLRLSSPPPVGAVQADYDDEDEGPQQRPSEPAEQKSEPKPAQTANAAQTGGRAQSAFAIPGGKSKGTPLDQADTRDLEYWANRIGGELESGNARDPERDAALHKAMCDEIAKREQGGKY